MTLFISLVHWDGAWAVWLFAWTDLLLHNKWLGGGLVDFGAIGNLFGISLVTMSWWRDHLGFADLGSGLILLSNDHFLRHWLILLWYERLPVFIVQAVVSTSFVGCLLLLKLFWPGGDLTVVALLILRLNGGFIADYLYQHLVDAAFGHPFLRQQGTFHGVIVVVCTHGNWDFYLILIQSNVG